MIFGCGIKACEYFIDDFEMISFECFIIFGYIFFLHKYLNSYKDANSLRWCILVDNIVINYNINII
jgi:hypothetical protein